MAAAVALASSLALAGCDQDEPQVCTAVLVTSVSLTIVDAESGEFVLDADITFRVDGGELRTPVEDLGEGGATWADLAYEEAGVFDVTVAAEGYETFKVDIRALEGGELERNIPLADGDTIFVPRAELIYVFGQVKNPGSYPIQRDTTVLQALSLAGGVTPAGAMGRIRIVRIVDGEKKEFRVKLTDIVQPGDTIIVPERYF